jgi:hypothetical protein
LWEKLQKIWYSIEAHIVQKLIMSMPQKLLMFIKQKVAMHNGSTNVYQAKGGYA